MVVVVGVVVLTMILKLQGTLETILKAPEFWLQGHNM